MWKISPAMARREWILIACLSIVTVVVVGSLFGDLRPAPDVATLPLCPQYTAVFEDALATELVQYYAAQRSWDLTFPFRALNTTFLEQTLYPAVVEANPDVACVVAFLRAKHLDLDPPFVIGHLVGHLFVAQRAAQDLADIEGTL